MQAFFKKHLLPPEQSSNYAWMKPGMLRLRLDSIQIESLEADLKVTPDDSHMRCLLIMHYGRDQHTSTDAAENFVRHVAWMIANQPEHSILSSPFSHLPCTFHQQAYARMVELWNEQVAAHPYNSAVVENAANFLAFENKPLAEQFFLHALSLNSLNSSLKARIASFYSLWDGHEAEAYLMLLSARKSQNLFDYFTVSGKLPEMAFNASRLEVAKKAALVVTRSAALLPGRFKLLGNASDAHTIIGRVALKKGDTRTAKKELAKSVVTFGSYMSEHFGFSLKLAQELAELGEKQAVLAFLDKRDYVRGVDSRSFELRYRLMHNRMDEDDDVAMTDEFLRDHLQYEYAALQKLEGEVRAKRIDRAINSTKSTIKIFAKDDLPHSPECTHDHSLRLALQIEFLEKLESLI